MTRPSLIAFCWSLLTMGGVVAADAQEVVWLDTLALDIVLDSRILVGPESTLFVSEIYSDDGSGIVHNDYSPRSWHLQCYTPDGVHLWQRRFNPLDTAEWREALWWDTGSIQATIDPDGTFWFWHPVFRVGEHEETPSWLVRYHLSQEGEILEQDTLHTRVSRVNPDGTATRMERLPGSTTYRFIRWGRDLRVKDTIEFPELDRGADSVSFILRELWKERGDTILLVVVNFGKPRRSYIRMKGEGGVDLFSPYDIGYDSILAALPSDVDFIEEDVLLLSATPWITLVRPGGTVAHGGEFAREYRERKLLSRTGDQLLVLERSPFTSRYDTLLIFDEDLTLLDLVDLAGLHPHAIAYDTTHGLFFSGMDPVEPTWMNRWENTAGRIALGVSGVSGDGVELPEELDLD